MSTPAPATRLPIPNSAQLTVRVDQEGQQSCFVLGFLGNQGGWTDTEGAQALLRQSWLAFRTVIGGDCALSGGVLRETSKLGNGRVYELGIPPGMAASTQQAGGAVGMIAAACGLIKWSTAQGGRSGKGRTFLPNLPGGAQSADGRTYSAAYSTAVNTACATYLGDTLIAAEGFVPAVLSFTDGAAYPITSGGLSARIGVQRRRMR